MSTRPAVFVVGFAGVVTLGGGGALLGYGLNRAPAEVRAEPKDDSPEARSEEAFFAGQVAFEAGAYDEALARFQAAQRLHPVAELDFDIGECHDRLGQDQQAIAAFEAYLRGIELRTGHRAHDHADVQRRIDALKGNNSTPKE